MKALTLAVFGLLCSSALALSSPLSPDPKLTPGDVLTSDPKIICVSGYTQTVRDVPQTLKNQVYKIYGVTTRKPREFEVDHLISLELGGSNSIRNLWPESFLTQPFNAHVKDNLENKLHDLACSGTITFAQAQQAIAKDWIGAYKKYVGALPGGVGTPASPTPSSSPSSSSASVQPNEDGSCPSSAPIKGSNNQKYHLPGGRYYDHTKARMCFASEADAQRAGYVKAKGQ